MYVYVLFIYYICLYGIRSKLSTLLILFFKIVCYYVKTLYSYSSELFTTKSNWKTITKYLNIHLKNIYVFIDTTENILFPYTIKLYPHMLENLILRLGNFPENGTSFPETREAHPQMLGSLITRDCGTSSPDARELPPQRLGNLLPRH